MIKYFQNHTFEKKTITATEVLYIQLLSYEVFLNKKIKMKTQNTMACSYHSKVTSTQSKGVPFFSCLGHGLKLKAVIQRCSVKKVFLEISQRLFDRTPLVGASVQHYICLLEYSKSFSDNSNLKFNVLMKTVN